MSYLSLKSNKCHSNFSRVKQMSWNQGVHLGANTFLVQSVSDNEKQVFMMLTPGLL